ncbi:MAG TPA: DsbE family thiol:disulfide interchange protein [Gammaproteobacteria bacterium]|nr:DsbE family thiol:disulfide interchange protein [Gammaproteobacteria bacterium]
MQNIFKKIWFILPLIIFIFIFGLLWRGLSLHPAQIPSPLIGQSAPDFALPTLFDEKKITTTHDLLGHVTLVNVWASWCAACTEEQATLLQLAKSESVFFYGLNYKDDIQDAKKWLRTYGNPYQIIAVDQRGTAAIDWGVYGTPETFVLDKKGVIRFKKIGPIDEASWEKDFKPLIEKLRKEIT